MKNNKFMLNTLLAVVVLLAAGTMMVLRLIQPAVILPNVNIPNLVLISLVALLADHYLAPKAGRCYICIPLLAAVTFGLLPFAAGIIGASEILKVAIVGAVVFTATTFLFTSMADRLSSGPKAHAALLSAFGLYLAAQCFAGMIL